LLFVRKTCVSFWCDFRKVDYSIVCCYQLKDTLEGVGWDTRDVKTALFGRCYNVKTVRQRCSDVALASCVGWEVNRNFC